MTINYELVKRVWQEMDAKYEKAMKTKAFQKSGYTVVSGSQMLRWINDLKLACIDETLQKGID